MHGTQEKTGVSQREHRYESFAYISIHGFEGQALIRNVSSGGFCMASKTYVTISRGEHRQMRIVPEPEAHIPVIDLEVEVRWTRISAKIFAAGFQIQRGSPSFNAYLTYLANKRPITAPAGR